MGNTNLPLTIKIAAYLGMVDAVIFLAIFGLEVFSVAHGGICNYVGGPPCNAVEEIAGYSLIALFLLLMAGLLFLFSRKIVQLKKSGWIGIVLILGLANILSFAVFWQTRGIGFPAVLFAYFFPFFTFSPLLLLIFGAKSFFKSAS